MIKSKKELQNILGFSYEEIEKILAEIDNYYYLFYKVKKDKLGRPKIKNGVIQTRPITPSIDVLKQVQKLINKKILTKIPLIPNIMGGVKGKSNIENANMHKGKKFRFQTDIEKCFPSISSKMVFNALRAKGFSKIIANLFSKIITYETVDSYRNRCLPQGTPTSTTMANIVLEKVAIRVLNIIKGRKIVFTLWVDDWTFSSNEDFKDLVQEIISSIGRDGFKISRDKTTYRHNKSIITGVVAGMSTLKVTETFREKGKGKLTKKQIKGRELYEGNVKKTNEIKIK